MDKKEILDILDNAKDERGAVPMRLVRQAFDKLVQPEERTEKRTETRACDLISRQAAIDEIVTWLKDRMTDGKNGKPLTDRIKDLPPAPPEYVTGFWMIRRWGDDAKCSNCGRAYKDVYDMDSHDAFCRCCGAKMEGIKVDYMRPIDADVLKQHIDKLPALPDGNFAGNHSALKALINMQPTVQPEVIYCGECELKIECCRNIRSGGRKDDDFCSCGRRAERRTDE